MLTVSAWDLSRRAALLGLAWSISVSAEAQQRVQLDAQARAIVDQLTLDRAATIAALQRRADEREMALLTQLAQRDRTLREALSDASVAQRARDQARTDLAEITARRQAAINQIAARDSQFRSETAEYRRQITSIAMSPDPRKREALARYAAGDRQGGMAVLIDIQSAETAAISAGWVDVAHRALDQYNRGELTRDETIDIVARAASVADTDGALWRSLSELLNVAGREEEASQAAARAASLTQ